MPESIMGTDLTQDVYYDGTTHGEVILRWDPAERGTITGILVCPNGALPEVHRYVHTDDGIRSVYVKHAPSVDAGVRALRQL